ncbi:MAG: tRNA lysidine(34) synthetase TilS [Ignavibacteria bacterium]
MAEAKRILIKTIEQKVLKFADRNKLISAGERILVALSGGPDSVFLFHILNKNKSRFKTELGTVHINHNLRGADSDGDEIFCRELSEKSNVEYFPFHADVTGFAKNRKVSIEEAAREIRYDTFKKISVEHSYNKIATAHNKSDNAETILLNLFKGTGLKGISGIPLIRGNIIRPVLCISKQEIMEYLSVEEISYRTDYTNNENIYERNFIRNVLLPEVKKKINPNVEDNLFNSGNNFRNSDNIVESYITQVMNDIVVLSGSTLSINLTGLKKVNHAAVGEILKRAVKDNFQQEFAYNDFLKIESLIENQKGRKIEIAGGIEVYRESGTLLIKRAVITDEFIPISIKTGSKVAFNGQEISIFEIENPGTLVNSGGFSEKISADSFSDEFILRRWLPGDKFIPLGMKGFKKISDFLSEQRADANIKKYQLVLVNGGNIVWVPGFRIDERYKIKTNTKRVLHLCLE